MMSLSNDHYRLRTVARTIGASCTRDFAGAVDSLASDFMIVGLLKALVMAPPRASEVGPHPATMLAGWLSQQFPSNERKGDSVIACVQWLLAVDDNTEWLMIEEEAAAYLAQLKIYAKAAKEKEREETPAKGAVNDRG
ncbi:hypothetical protein AncyloWKF20_11275 [Ancylobacter sp. WKF20]|uniref:hypothetical protein n=1 Tax=Ancylobacter sp. WKF20 TaxID=3039801 RepID=UPI0024344672|nr:hypothetical protein [Ancylobacter sp. WKF20]WGD28401.1 hypothetical protein AncyloWKF20_11275 [Ancylobacter sp. WKF20]